MRQLVRVVRLSRLSAGRVGMELVIVAYIHLLTRDDGLQDSPKQVEV
jgi:hypothetical protein